jgi:2-methylcitrate dehydratase PrpD
MLAAKGFDCTDDALEAGQGFVDVFSSNANLALAVDGLGRDFELLANGYKPYPCGIVIHPTIDACLEIRQQLGPDAELGSVSLTVHPSTLVLTGVRTPTSPLDAQISVFHWAAAALLRGKAGVPEMRQECFGDPAIAALRDRVSATPDATLGPGEAIAEVTTASGQIYRSHIVEARGSANKPLTDGELDAKYRGQAMQLLPAAKADELLRVCRSAPFLSDIGGNITRVWEGCF